MSSICLNLIWLRFEINQVFFPSTYPQSSLSTSVPFPFFSITSSPITYTQLFILFCIACSFIQLPFFVFFSENKSESFALNMKLCTWLQLNLTSSDEIRLFEKWSFLLFFLFMLMEYFLCHDLLLKNEWTSKW